MEEKFKYWKTKTLRNASSISKIKVKYNYPPSIGEYSETKVKSKINEIMISLSTYTQNSKTTAAKLIKEENLKNAKESVIISLREDLEYHKQVNKHYLLYKQYATDICNYYKQNFDEIFKFKSDLREDLSDFIKVVEGFEAQMKKYDKEKADMIRTNNDIIKYKNEENEKMNQKINKLNGDLEIQKNKLDKINATLNEYRNENENYLNKLNSNELNHLEKYEELEDKYKRLKAQYEVYFNMEIKKRKLELDFKDDNLCRDEKDKVNLKLQDKIIKNIFLKEIANEIKKQINEIESINQRTAEEEQLIRFLGKAFYNKVKQRRAENDKSKEVNKTRSKSKSKSKIYVKTERSKRKEKIESKNRRKNSMKKKYGLNLILSQIDCNSKNKNKINKINTYSNNIYGNHLKETCFTSYKNTKNKINSTSSGTF